MSQIRATMLAAWAGSDVIAAILLVIVAFTTASLSIDSIFHRLSSFVPPW